MRFFEKISYEQFNKDFENTYTEYEKIILPKRSTKSSAGYDFYAPFSFELKPNEIKKIPTGIKVKLNDDEFLGIYVRSSMGFKYNVRMCNQVGIIDADYYNNEDNEGHIWIRLQNEGNQTYIVNNGDKYCQGIIQKYYLTDDDNISSLRNGGIGSTNKGED